MYIFLISLVWGLFAGVLFLNVYFRVRVFKLYKILENNHVEFGASHIFNQQKMEKEIYSKYPKLRPQIETFVNYIKTSIKMASVLTGLITLFGFILMYYSRR